ncbi:MAG: LOG family protein [Acidobacteriota bacterium]|nr:LOG family protein [Acidobacteriota bacterium]
MTKAYKNLGFLASREARTIRLLSEYLEPQSRFASNHVKDTVVFFGSARAVPLNEAEEALERAESAGKPEAIEDARRVVRLSRFYDDARALARLLTEWSKGLQPAERRFLVCSGGGPGIMEAANRGASDASGVSIGLGISLPSEPASNDFITRQLAFEFHYFFMRKFWFVYLAKAMVVFPGGFGTLDELFELLTLVQTRKVSRPLPIVLYGREYWDSVIDFDALVRWGTISREDLDLMYRADSPADAFGYLQAELTRLYLDDDNPSSQ